MSSEIATSNADVNPEPLGIQSPLLPHQPLGAMRADGSLRFNQPLGARSLTVLDPSIFSPGTVSPIQAFLEPFQAFQPQEPSAIAPQTVQRQIEESEEEPEQIDTFPIQRQVVGSSEPAIAPKNSTIPTIQRQVEESEEAEHIDTLPIQRQVEDFSEPAIAPQNSTIPTIQRQTEESEEEAEHIDTLPIQRQVVGN
ncbi:MAG: hypothetical protein VKJ24_06075, partial [Synechococcales bacterium]|nr:hypothetical protein [Synechococcales bacterium]